MELTRTLLDEAIRALKTADHLTYVTYPLIHDIKLLVGVKENLFFSLKKAMEALVQYEMLYKRIEPVKEDFNAQFEALRLIAGRYKLNETGIRLLKDLELFTKKRKRSQAEFIKKDKLILCSREFSAEVVSLDAVKKELALTKELLGEINKVIVKGE